MIVGDNIYHQVEGSWQQLNSHHSYPNGFPNPHNVANDTQTNAVLISDYYFYFGAAAIEIPPDILQGMNYKNGRNHRTFNLAEAHRIISFIVGSFTPNRLQGDPSDFEDASARYSAEDDKVTVEG